MLCSAVKVRAHELRDKSKGELLGQVRHPAGRTRLIPRHWTGGALDGSDRRPAGPAPAEACLANVNSTP